VAGVKPVKRPTAPSAPKKPGKPAADSLSRPSLAKAEKTAEAKRSKIDRIRELLRGRDAVRVTTQRASVKPAADTGQASSRVAKSQRLAEIQSRIARRSGVAATEKTDTPSRGSR